MTALCGNPDVHRSSFETRAVGRRRGNHRGHRRHRTKGLLSLGHGASSQGLGSGFVISAASVVPFRAIVQVAASCFPGEPARGVQRPCAAIPTTWHRTGRRSLGTHGPVAHPARRAPSRRDTPVGGTVASRWSCCKACAAARHDAGEACDAATFSQSSSASFERPSLR